MPPKGESGGEVRLASPLASISFLRFSSMVATYPATVPRLNCSPIPVSSAASVCLDCAHSQCSLHLSSGVSCLKTTMYWFGIASVVISDMARYSIFLYEESRFSGKKIFCVI